MKKKVLSAVIAAVIAITSITSTGFVVSATPLTEAASKYDELSEKVNALEQKIQELDAQISPLQEKMNNNEIQIENINKEIEQTNKDIEQAKVQITEKEEVLGKRLREVYKTGGQTSYISLLFSADSFSDLISKIDSAGRIVNIDKKVVQDLTKNKDKLDNQILSLETKANEIVKINEQVQVQKAELDKKKAEQMPIIDQAKAEKEEFDRLYLSDEEEKIVRQYVDICNDANSSQEQLQSAIDTLRSIRDYQPLKSLSVIEKVNASIENAKELVKSKAVVVNRGGITVTGDVSGIVAYASQFIGRPYVTAGNGPSSFDCSGFTSYVYSHLLGINITRTTFSQINVGREVSQSELQPGDLVFPHSGHVGIYVGGGQMIHAPQTGDHVRIAPVYRFWRARRIVN